MSVCCTGPACSGGVRQGSGLMMASLGVGLLAARRGVTMARAGGQPHFCRADAFAAPASAAETAGAWRVIQSDEFRQGFVAGIASYLLDQLPRRAGRGGIRAGYAECLAGRTDRSLLDVVDYMDRHPESGRAIHPPTPPC